MKNLKSIATVCFLFLLLPFISLALEITGELTQGQENIEAQPSDLEAGIVSGAINNLSASIGNNSGEVDLSWNIPSPIPADLEVKYSTSEITLDNYGTATAYSQSWSGSSTSGTASGLTPGMIYYFAMKGIAGSLESEISNVVSAVVKTAISTGGGGSGGGGGTSGGGGTNTINDDTSDNSEIDTSLKTPEVKGVTTTEIIDGDIIQCQTSDNPFAVYVVKIIDDTKYIRHIVSLEIFNYYGHLKWENLKQAESLDEYSLSGWVRYNTGENNTPSPTDKVYEINGDQTKHWINMTAEQFLSHGGSEPAIFNINQGELNLYITGADVMSL